MPEEQRMTAKSLLAAQISPNAKFKCIHTRAKSSMERYIQIRSKKGRNVDNDRLVEEV